MYMFLSILKIYINRTIIGIIRVVTMYAELTQD